MKLRNKKTGVIHEITEVVPLHDMVKKFVIYSKTEGHNYAYKNLAELNEEWEDYKESKEAYFITEYGEVFPLNVYEDYNNVANLDDYKQLGNYFDSREEAEKAVEKLKAWKRLKENGYKFNGIGVDYDGYKIYFKCDIMKKEHYTPTQDHKDLDLLFGGEE